MLFRSQRRKPNVARDGEKQGDARPARGARMGGVLKHRDGVTCMPVIGVFSFAYFDKSTAEIMVFVFVVPHCWPMIQVC